MSILTSEGAQSDRNDRDVKVAIIGGGIVGLVLAIGLIRLGVKVQVYERAQGFREIGAGIAFTANAVRCMELISPNVTLALRNGGAVKTSAGDEDFLRWIDGFDRGRTDNKQNLFFKLSAGYRGFEGTRRDMFLENLVKHIPPEHIHLKKRLENIECHGAEHPVMLKFADGTVAHADAVIGCDGVKSTVRSVMLGPDHPSARPSYSHCIAYRALVPMDKAIEALGEYKALNAHNHCGPGANVLHYPVANNTVLNAVTFVRDPEVWADDNITTGVGTRQDVLDALTGWCPPVRKLVEQFPDTMPKWAIFDTYENPLAKYNFDRVVLAGDAAHGSSPHHGAGACQGIEDALCLTVLLEQVAKDVEQRPQIKFRALRAAFESFDANRRVRSQWLVNSSRRICELHQQQDFADPTKICKAKTNFDEVKDRSLKIWHYDYDEMLSSSLSAYRHRTSDSSGVQKDTADLY